MKHTKHIALILALAMLLALLAGCGSGQDETTETTETTEATETTEQILSGTAVVVTDMTGRQIVLEEPATRVVALSAADCEILYAIGAGDTLVGRGSYCDYPAEVLELPVVESGEGTNLEQILALEPQVLLMSAMAQTKEQVAALENAGVHVVVSDADDITGTFQAIEMIGALMGKDEEAAALVESMDATFRKIMENSTANFERTIYFEVSPLEYGLWAAGRGTFMDEIAGMLGLTNIFSDVDGWGQVSEEQVLERDPDFIVTVAMDLGEGPNPVEEILSRPGWENVTAVSNGSILNLQNNELSRPAPRLAEGAQMMYDFVYGPVDK